jgi:flagellar biosynthesis/type III secretory pathway chaperone
MHLSNLLEESVNDKLFDSLIDVLTGERSVYRELKKFLISERDLLVKSSAFAEISKCNAAKENIILKARISQEARINLLKKISRNLDINEEGVSLASLAVYAGSGKRQIIENLRNDLLQISAEIELINKENSYILDKSIYNIKVSLELLTSLVDRSGIYLGNGKIGIMQNNGRLLSTEG